MFDQWKLKARSLKAKQEAVETTYGRVSAVQQDMKTISNTDSRTFDLLTRLTAETDMIKAIEIVVNETPDGKMASNAYVRLSNQGFNPSCVTWKTQSGNKVTKKRITEFTDFCKKFDINSIVDQLVFSSITRGGMALEVVVDSKLAGISDIVLIDPATIKEFKLDESTNKYRIYQGQGSQSVDLTEGNFFWSPHQPKVGSPKGTLQFAPAVATTTQYLQLLNDSLQVIARIGYPRYDFSIDRKTLFDSLVDKSPKNQKKAAEEVFESVKTAARQMKMNSDFVHFDEVKADTIGGGVNGAGIDVRAWFEALDPLISNAFQLTPVLMGRLKGGSYSLGTVEFKIVTDTVESMRRSYEKALEYVFDLWARVNGYAMISDVVLPPLDWEKELDKLKTDLLKLEKTRRFEEYGYISKDDAAILVADVEAADNNNSDGRYEFLKYDSSTKTEETTVDDLQENQNEIGGEEDAI